MSEQCQSLSIKTTELTVIQSAPSWLPQTQTWLFNQVRFLPPDVENHVVCDHTENLDQFSVPNIHCLSEAAMWRYFWDKGLQRLQLRRHSGFLMERASRYHARVLHSHFGPTGWANIGTAKKAGLKHIVTFYGYDVNKLPMSDPVWLGRYSELFAHADRVLCEGSYMARCLATLGCPEDKLRVQRLGVTIDEIEFRPRVWNSGEPLRVLIAASFRQKKGIPDALEALSRLQHEIPLAITIIGDASDEVRSRAEKVRILKTIALHELQPKVRMLGYQPHAVMLKEAYEHHVFLSPSLTADDGDTEGGAPVSVIEMAATGMPIVSTRHCDIPGIVVDGITGLLAEERDVDGLEDHIRWLVNHPAGWRSMVEGGRRRVEQEFNARVQGARLRDIYLELVADE